MNGHLRIGIPIALGIACIVAGSLAFLGGAPELVEARTHEPSAYASVDGVVITRADYDAYARVLSTRDGTLRVSREQVLLSLINQVIVEREADRRGLVVTADEVATAVADFERLRIAGSLERTGGKEGLSKRMRMFRLFKLVKSAVLGIPAEHGELHDHDHAGTEDRMLQRQREVRWLEWLRAQRACADIAILDTSFVLESVTARR